MTAEAQHAVPARAVWLLGLSQLICWGTTYYLVGVFADQIAADLGWSDAFVQAGFSVGLGTMAVTSPFVGRLIDAWGGRAVMSAGSLFAALGAVMLAAAHGPVLYFAAWLVLGLAMRMTLYEAAFASLARIGGPQAGRAIAQVTLLGGLASTVFWPIGIVLSSAIGWRGATLMYAAVVASTVALHAALPPGRTTWSGLAAAQPQPSPARRPSRSLSAILYVEIAMVAAFLNSGMAAHMIGILAGLGLGTAVAVSVSSLRGIGQFAARLCDVLFGRRINPLDLNLAACAAMPFCFVAGLWGGKAVAAAVVFAFFYGVANGLLTITRGTLPLVLFDVRRYGAITGRLLAPSYVAAAVAPFGYARARGWWGDEGALLLSAAVASSAAVAALVLRLRFEDQPAGPPEDVAPAATAPLMGTPGSTPAAGGGGRSRRRCR